LKMIWTPTSKRVLPIIVQGLLCTQIQLKYRQQKNWRKLPHVPIEDVESLINVNVTIEAWNVIQIKHYNPYSRSCNLLHVLYNTCTKHTKIKFENDHWKHI
jgi:hypothetical protein